MQKLAVFGGTGIIGRSITEYFDTQDDWQGIGVACHKQQISELTLASAGERAANPN